MISDCDVTHCCCHMSLFILIRVNHKDIDKIFLAHCPQMAVAPQSMFIVGPGVQTNKQTSVTPSHPGETLRDKLSDHVKSLNCILITQLSYACWMSFDLETPFYCAEVCDQSRNG